MSPLLEMRDIVKKFGPVKALDGVSIRLEQGEILSLCGGENGSGKSTLMKVLCGIYPAGDYQGDIIFKGNKITPKKHRRHRSSRHCYHSPRADFGQRAIHFRKPLSWLLSCVILGGL